MKRLPLLLLFLLPLPSSAGFDKDGTSPLSDWEKYQVEVHLPSFEIAKKMTAAASKYKEQVLKGKGLYTVRRDDWDALCEDAKYRDRCWDSIYWIRYWSEDSVEPKHNYAVRFRLNELIKIMGVENYMQARWPSPIPPGN